MSMNYIVAAPLAEGAAQQLGKKGSENGLTYYNGSYKGSTIVALVPQALEDRFYTVAEALLLADAIVVGTADIGKLFGEVIVACSLVGKKVFLTKENDASMMLKGVAIEAEAVDRFELPDKIAALWKKGADEGCRIDIDKAFPVTGVGTVALGFVMKGSVSVHDRLFLPSGIEVTIKSIQSNDVGVESAGVGTRVGLALKNVKPEEIRKGDLLCKEAVPQSSVIEALLEEAGIAKEALKEGAVYGFVSGFSYTSAAVMKTDPFTLRLERPLPLQQGDSFMLVRAREPRIFACGSAEALYKQQ